MNDESLRRRRFYVYLAGSCGLVVLIVLQVILNLRHDQIAGAILGAAVFGLMITLYVWAYRKGLIRTRR